MFVALTFPGVSLCTITDAAVEAQKSMDNETRCKTLTFITTIMHRFLKELNRKSRMHGNVRKAFYVLRHGSSLVIMYPFVKLLYIGNVLFQLFAINFFLGTSYSLYGFDAIADIVRGEKVINSKRFPRVTLCDFKIRILGNTQRYTVQCALPINLYNEIIFIFLWFWFVFVAMATTGSFFVWIWRAFYLRGNYTYVKTQLIAMNKLKRAPSWVVEKFVREYLQRDGVFILRMVARNSSDLIAAEIVTGLWDKYKQDK